LGTGKRPQTKQEEAAEEDEGSTDSEEGLEIVNETDAERRQTLLSSKQEDDDIEFLGTGKDWTMFQEEFSFGQASGKKSGPGSSRHLGTIEIPSEDDEDHCDLPQTSGSMSVIGQSSARQQKGKSKDKGTSSQSAGQGSKNQRNGPTPRNGSTNQGGGVLGLGKLVQTEIDFRKKESIGLASIQGGGRTLGSSKPRGPSPALDPAGQGVRWNCKICTL
jgi:hypothetical protein